MITEAQSGYSFCIITNGKRPAKLRREIESIRALNIPACEILVSGEVPPGFEDVRIVPALDAARNGRLGEMRNRLTEAAQYDHLVVCDDDLIFQQDFYRGLCDFGENYDVLCVRFLNPDGTRYWDWATSGGPRGHYLLDYDLTDPFVYVTGGLCVMKAYVASKVKWDDARGFYQAEDIDFSDRLKQAGFTIKLCTASSVIHDDNSYTQIDIAVVKRPDITKEIQVTPQVYGTGIYAAESALPPGVHWIAQECELRIPAAAFSCASAVSFDLAAANANYYESFPIEVEVTSDGQTIGKTVIPRSMQSIRAALQVAPRSNDLRIKIKSSSSFVPGHRGLWRDPRELALMLHNLHVAPLSVPETVKQAASCAPAPTASDPPLQQQHVDPPANAGPLSAHCIGIDARTLTYTESTVRGIGHYTFHLLRTLAAANRNDQYILFLDEPIHNEHIDELSALANVSIRYFSSEDPFPGLDLYLIPDPMSSPTGFDSPFVLAPRNIPLSVIFYDLIPLVLHEDHYDTWTSAVQAAYMRRLAQIKRTNALVFTISEHTKRDLQQHTGIAPGQIRTVMAGLNSSQGISPREREIAQTIQKYKISSPFFLFVGSHEPHKGFSVAVSAFLQARQQQPMELIVVGSAEDPFKALNQKFLNEHKIGGIKFTGHIPRRDLECLYAGAAALIFPSSYEGFGFPALEAMANSCPVITSNAASIPEVVGNAALAFEPKDTAAISGAMLQLVNNRELRSTMITRGLGRAQLFTWEKTAAAVKRGWEEQLQLAAKHPARAAETATPAPASSRNIPACAETRVAWLSHALNMSGYAVGARNLVKGFAARGYPADLICFCHATQGSLDARTIRTIGPMIKDQPAKDSVLVLQHLPAGHDGFDAAGYIRKSYPGMKRYVMTTMFETDLIPNIWVSPCNSMDEVWVGTKFNMETFARSGVRQEKLRLVPFLGFDPSVFAPQPNPVKFPGEKQYNFLSLFEWTKRKGWDVLLRAFIEEFRPDEDAALNLYVCRGLGTNGQKTANMLAMEYISETFRLSPKDLPVINIFEGLSLPDSEMPRFYAGANAFVLPSRGEGWGMPYLEAMAMGLPVIGTNWSGNTEFMNRENSYLIDIEGLRPVDSSQIADNPFYTGHNWAEPSCAHLRELMRYAFTNREAAAKTGDRARRDVHNKWTIYHAADRVMQRVNEIAAEVCSQSTDPRASCKPAVMPQVPAPPV